MRHRLLILVLLLPWRAFAAGPYVVDDADIAPLHTVQNENWVSRTSRDKTSLVTNAAYQLLPNAEFSLQAESDAQRADHDDALSPQIKYLWYNDKENHIKSSAVVAADYSFEADRVTGLYAYVPVSFKATESLDVNLNLGWEQLSQADHYLNRDYLTWGINSEYHATKELSFIGELFGRDDDRPGYQLGPHYIVSKAAELDLVYGNHGQVSAGNIVTAGLTLNF